MLKHKVVSIQVGLNGLKTVTTAPSEIGDFYRGNKYVPQSIRMEYPPMVDIQVGDVLRCDGLPFQAPPYHRVGNYNYSYIGYRQHKLTNGMYVLRPHYSI